jgi:glycosyltransferase involved in cell wall biosynthesis
VPVLPRGVVVSRPRVMVVTPQPGAAGGVAVVAETLLASELAARFELLLVATHRDAGRAGKLVQALSGIARAAWLLARRRVDLVYLLTSSGASLRRKALVAALARFARRPYVVHVHASDFDTYYRDAPPWEQRLVRATLARAALVIALSPTWEQRLQEIVRCRTTAIPNPVAIPAEPARPDTSRPTIVSLGRVGERKGSQTLVQAFARVAERHPDIRLVLAGDGDLQPVLGSARALGVDERVELPGWVGPAERARILGTASVFALPSREEGLPVALLEAMAYGLPSVVSPVGGIPDAFEDGRHGYFVPPDDPDTLADRLQSLLDDPAAAREMGCRARADAEQLYAIPIVAALLAAALESALAEVGRVERNAREI